MRKPSPMPFVVTAVVAFAATLAHAQATATATTAAPATSTSSTIPNGPAIGPTTDASSFGPDSSFSSDSGNPPRIIGIAQRTDVDRIDEMPDDPIIRY